MDQTYRQKALFHVKRAEHWQSLVQAYEDEAMRKAPQVVQGRRQIAGEVLKNDYVAKTLLQGHYGYAQACANRNAHQNQANMYALLAVLGPDE